MADESKAYVADPVDTSHLQIYADHMAKIFHLISTSQVVSKTISNKQK